MVSTLLNEQRISIAEAGRRAGNVKAETIWRWRTKGIAGVKLESFVIGGRRFTSVEALDRFITRVTEARDVQGRDSNQPEDRSPSTERRLASAGLLP